MNTVKKRLSALILSLALVLLLPAGLLCCGAALPSYYGDSYYAVLPQMTDRLRTVQGKKIVLLGGSNVAFGVNTALMEELLANALGEPCSICSFGLYGAVGAEAMLSLSAPCLKEGDLVVLCFEPTAESQSDYFGAVALWKCLEDRPDLLASLTGAQKGAMAGSYLAYLQERAAYAIEGAAPQPTGAYTRAAFDGRCDMVYDRPGNLLSLGFDTAVTVDFSSLAPQSAFARAVRSYVKQARDAGAQVVLSFSPVNAACVRGAEDLPGYFQRCQQSYGVTAISDPRRYILDSGWFYDSNFHLNSAGAELRSVLLAEDLLGFLGCYQKVDHPLPQLPPSAAPAEEEDPALAACFTFRPVEGGAAAGWVVSGLTPEGQTRTVLRLPAAYQGGAVVGFDPGIFSLAPALEELTLPATIDAIPDHAFVGNPNLTRLVLLHLDRTPALGEHPFDGADPLQIYVPKTAYPMYREGFGCAVNPWEPYLDRVNGY